MSNENARPSNGDYADASTAIARIGFGSQEMERRNETHAVAAAETAKALVQARYIVAMQRPRDVDDFRIRILKHCKRERFAAAAEYAKPVGGKKMKGASIRFVEAALQEYRNVQVSATPFYDDAEKRIVHVSVTDLESNSTHELDVIAEKFVERRSTKQGDEVIGERRNSYGEIVYRVRATEDDFANKMNAAISKTIRNLGLRVLPSDIVAECMDACLATREAEDKRDPDAAKRAIADAFAALGVTPAALKEYLGHDIGSASPAEIDDLRNVFVAVRDGEAQWTTIIADRRGGTASDKPVDAAASKLKEKLSKGAPKAEKPADDTKEG